MLKNKLLFSVENKMKGGNTEPSYLHAGTGYSGRFAEMQAARFIFQPIHCVINDPPVYRGLEARRMSDFQFTLGQLTHGVTYQQYADAEGLRSGWLQEIRRSPAHLQEAIKNPKEPTPALILGQKIHHALENPEKFLDLAVCAPKFTGLTKDGRESSQSAEARKAKESWYADVELSGKIALTTDDYATITGILKAVREHRLTRNLLAKGYRETSIRVKDPETGQVLKCRPDFIHEEGFLVDHKSARDASRLAFGSEIFSEFKQFYILNAAHYVHCLKLAGIGRKDEATLIALEKEPPYALNVFPLDAGHLDLGERWRASLTRKYAECVSSGIWPAYDEKAVCLEIPQYSRYPDESSE